VAALAVDLGKVAHIGMADRQVWDRLFVDFVMPAGSKEALAVLELEGDHQGFSQSTLAGARDYWTAGDCVSKAHFAWSGNKDPVLSIN